MTAKRIFISSTYEDLKDYREKVAEILRRLDTVDIAMEHFGARDEKPKEECLRLIDEESDIYVGIFAYKYGYIPAGDEVSITESEYREAKRQGLPCLIYILLKDAPWPEDYIEHGESARKLEELKTKLKSNHMVGFFSSPSDLSAKIAADVGREIVRQASRSEAAVQRYPHDTDRELRLISDLQSADKFKARRAIRALSHSESAWLIDSLKYKVLGKDEELAQEAIDALASLPDIAPFQAIGQGFLAKSLSVRKWAAYSLGEAALCGRREDAQNMVDVLVNVMKNPAESFDVLDEVVHALGKIGGARSFDALVSVIQSDGVPSDLKGKALYSGSKFFEHEFKDRFIKYASISVRSWSYDHLATIKLYPLFTSFPDPIKQSINKRLDEIKQSAEPAQP